VEKLGIKPGFRLIFLHQPNGFAQTLGPLPDDIVLTDTLEGQYDLVHYFAGSAADLKAHFADLKEALRPAASLWISWPKGGSGITTDLNENIIREIGLAHGLVDVKVIAVDETWSGLKFVYRLKDR